MVEVFVGLGSNLGDPSAYLRQALSFLAATEGISGMEVSPFYRSAPVGKLDQAWFVNAVACFRSSLSPADLLALCLEVERRLGRTRHERWGPRTLDIDLLLYGEERIETESLKVPHPEMEKRAFVLRPLWDLRPDLTLAGQPLVDLLARLGDQQLSRMD